jgi:hypothetical protein
MDGHAVLIWARIVYSRAARQSGKVSKTVNSCGRLKIKRRAALEEATTDSTGRRLADDWQTRTALARGQRCRKPEPIKSGGSALQQWSVIAAVIRCKVVDDDLGIGGPNWRTERRDHLLTSLYQP